MERPHRDRLMRHLVLFSNDLDLSSVIPYLISAGVFSNTLAEKVYVKETTVEQRCKFIELIQTRGPTAYTRLFEALIYGRQYHLAKCLFPDAHIPEIDDENSNPGTSDVMLAIESIANPVAVSFPVFSAPTIQEIQGNENFYGNAMVAAYREVPATMGIMEDMHVDGITNLPVTFNESTTYRNFTHPKGLALIINNKKFQTLPERLGSDVDATNLENLFKQLGYKTKVKRNLKSLEMLDKINKFTDDTAHRSADSALIAILSHGEYGGLYGADDELVDTDRIVSLFSAQNAPYLKGKPKIIFIQACRGKTYDQGDMTDGDADTNEEVDANTMQQRNSMKLPSIVDVLVANATIPGYVSWRNSVRGSWFIQAICEIFPKHAKDEDILGLLTLVNAKVAEAFTSGCGHKQIPQPSFQLTKKFYFYPRVKYDDSK